MSVEGTRDTSQEEGLFLPGIGILARQRLGAGS